jgi:hypothetical protein
MADTHPFANAGLGMFGVAEKQAVSKGMNPDNNDKDDKAKKLIGGGFASILKSLGVGQDTETAILQSLGIGQNTENQPGKAPPAFEKVPVIPSSSSYQPLTSQYGFGANPAQQSIQQTTPDNSSYFMKLNQNNEAKDLNFIDSFKIPRLGGL